MNALEPDAKRASGDTQQKMEDFAKDLAKMLERPAPKPKAGWVQRQAIVKNLTELRDTASSAPF